MIAAPLVAGPIIANQLGAINPGDLVSAVARVVCFAMTFMVPLWTALLAAALVFATILLFRAARRPRWANFTQMRHREHLFRWVHKLRGPADFEELCMWCGCVVEIDDRECLECGSRANPVPYERLNDYVNELTRVIKTKIENGKYKKIMGDMSKEYPFAKKRETSLY